MKKRLIITISISFTFAALLNLISLAAESTISDSQASQYIGKNVSVKGTVANVYISQKGNIFLNFDHPYPNHIFSAVIFSDDSQKFRNPKMYEGQTVIVRGKVQNYEGRPEIILKNTDQISIAK